MKTVNHNLSTNTELENSIEGLKKWFYAQPSDDVALQAMLLVGAGILIDIPNQTASMTFTDATISLSLEKRGALQ